MIETRSSVRAFSDRPVADEVLNKLLEAGRIAPTAGNRQPQRILVVKSAEGLQKMSECTPCRYGAPVVLVVCYDPAEENTNFIDDEMGYGQIDASIVLTHIMLKATELGLGTTWVGLFKNSLLRKNFNIPEQYRIVSLMPVGYPKGNTPASDNHGKRFALEHTCFFESF